MQWVKYLGPILYFVSIAQTAQGSTIVVSSTEQFNRALSSLAAGDAIVIADGDYPDLVMNMTKSGTADNLITIRPQTPGRVVLGGSSSVTLSGNYVALTSFTFRGIAGVNINVNGNHEKIERNSFIGGGTKNGTPAVIQLQATATYNDIGFNTFTESVGYSVWFGNSASRVPTENTIHDNTFRSITSPPRVLSMGGGNTAKAVRWNTLVQKNMFEDVTVGVVNVYSSGNTFSGNRAINSFGQIQFQAGTLNTVDGATIDRTGTSYQNVYLILSGSASMSQAATTLPAGGKTTKFSSFETGYIPGLAPAHVRAPYTCLRRFYVSTIGSDSNDGATSTAAFRTIRHAVSAAPLTAGDCVIVAPGIYNENGIVVAKSGASDTPAGRIAIVSQTPGAAYIRYPVTDPSPNHSIFQISGSHVVVDGFDVQGINVPAWTAVNGAHDGANYQNGITSQASYVTFINNISHDNGGGGIATAFGDHVTIEGNVIYGNARTASNAYSGVSVYQAQGMDDVAGYHIVIRNNIIYGNGELNAARSTHTDGNGIILDDFQNTQKSGRSTFKNFPYPSLVENNLVFANGGRGIHVNYSDNVLVRNNTVFDNSLDPLLTSRGELSVYFGSNVTFANNIAIANADISGNQVALEGNTILRNIPTVSWRNNILAYDSPTATMIYFQPNDDYLATAITAANGNLLGSQPGFIDPEKHDFRLVAASPAIAAGTTAFGSPRDDVAGMTRALSRVDIGAYAWSAK